MPLKSLEIENYRGIERARVTFDATTVVFGENDSGLPSLVEALRLVLGTGSSGRLEGRVAPYHFRRTDTGATRPLHIRVEVTEPAPASWTLPEWMERTFPARDTPRTLLFDFRAVLDAADGAATASHRIAARNPGSAFVPGNDESEAWLRSAYPVLWLDSDRLTEVSPTSDHADTGSPPLALDADVAALALHRGRLLSGTTTDVRTEIAAGAAAARALLDKFPDVFADMAPVMSAMATEILRHATLAEAGDATAASGDAAARDIAAVLLLGALVDLARDAVRDGPLPAQARPVLLVENPESGLHPTTLAALWRLLERLTWQQVVRTNSDLVLGNVPLTALRRVSRSGGTATTWAVRPSSLSRDAVRKVSYHLRSRRAAAMFARCWILVEGETEYWMLGELARVLGYDLGAEGVAAVEFAQAGISPLLRLADELGIGCQVMVDGDEAGQHYATLARDFHQVRSRTPIGIAVLEQRDIEHCFWANGFADVIASVAHYEGDLDSASGTHVIHDAIDRTSKPYLALALIDAAVQRGRDSVPGQLRRAVEAAIERARAAD